MIDPRHHQSPITNHQGNRQQATGNRIIIESNIRHPTFDIRHSTSDSNRQQKKNPADPVSCHLVFFFNRKNHHRSSQDQEYLSGPLIKTENTDAIQIMIFFILRIQDRHNGPNTCRNNSMLLRGLVLLLLITTASAVNIHPSTPTATASSNIPVSFCTRSIPFCLLQLRAGSLEDEYEYENDDDEYDEYDDNDDEQVEEEFSRGRGRPPPAGRGLPPPQSRGRGTPPMVPKLKKSKHWSQRMASQSLQMGGKLAWNTVKQPGKLAYHLIRPKHVDLEETGGLWRLDQQVTMKGDRQVASVATIELNPRRRLVLVRQHKENATEEKVTAQSYTFKKSKLGFYKTSFVAPAFLIGDTPRLYGYKGTWQRKVADKSVIKLVGNIYEVRKQKFGREKGSFSLVGKPAGTFVARRRIKMTEDEDEDEVEEDVYDEEGEVYDEYEEEYDA